MQIIDITQGVFSAEIYPGDTVPTLTKTKTIEKDGYSLSFAEIGMHNGTHIDAPSHFIDGGDGAEKIDLNKCIGEVSLVTCNEKVTLKDVKNYKNNCRTRIILRNGEINGLIAWEMCNSGFTLIGTDKLSIGDKQAHQTLLKHGVIILENLNLNGADDGDYHLVALPLKIEGAEGAPCRAVLMK